MPENPLLGDKIENILNSWGVTQECYKSAKAWLMNVRPQDVTCACDWRKATLNQIDLLKRDCFRFFGWK
jgi:hypothetical protein